MLPMIRTMSVISIPIIGANSLHVEASWTPAESMKFVAITPLMTCCVVRLYRVCVYWRGLMDRVLRHFVAVRLDPIRYAIGPTAR